MVTRFICNIYNIILVTLRRQIDYLFQDPIGQWLSKEHQEEKNEYALLINDQDKAATRIIDRTFIDQGIRWIIDFKTGSKEEETEHQHRQQLNNYAELLARNSEVPIRCGLYYLASGNWLHWDYISEVKKRMVSLSF